MEISDDEDEAMAWSPGRKHKVVTLSCTQYTCSHLTSSPSPQASCQAEQRQEKRLGIRPGRNAHASMLRCSRIIDSK